MTRHEREEEKRNQTNGDCLLTPHVKADQVTERRAHRVFGHTLVLAAILLGAGADLEAP